MENAGVISAINGTKNMSLTKENVNKHSTLALNMWRDLWKENCLKNKDKIYNSHKDFLNIYKDKIAVLFAYGPSFEDNVNKIKDSDIFINRDKYVIGCVDKAFKPLCEKGVYPDYCLLADGTISAEDWLHGVDNAHVQNCYLVSNIYGSSGWCQHWNDVAGKEKIIFYLNKDNIKSEEIFGPIAEFYEVIEAASNCGNSLAVFTTKIFGCKTTLLFAFDYGFTNQYYGTCDSDKRWKFGTNTKIDIHGDLIRNTSNMDFSATWLETYIAYSLEKYKAKIINYTNNGLIRGKEAMEVEVKIY